MNRRKLIDAIASKDLESIKAEVGQGRDKTLMVDSDGYYLGTKTKADEGRLKGSAYIRFVKTGGQING